MSDTLISNIEEFRDSFTSDHPLMVMADAAGENQLNTIASMINGIRMACEQAIESLKAQEVSRKIDSRHEEEVTAASMPDFLAAYATELDASGDPELMKQATVLDEILLTFGRPDGAVSAVKQAEEQEIDRLRTEYSRKAREQAYDEPRKKLQADMKASETAKAIEKQVKHYRPMEAALSTRTCPDHPGAQMLRVADGIVQCSLDKKMYNYHGGFTTLKNSIVPGGEVSNQTQGLNNLPPEHMQFNTRESQQINNS